MFARRQRRQMPIMSTLKFYRSQASTYDNRLYDRKTDDTDIRLGMEENFCNNECVETDTDDCQKEEKTVDGNIRLSIEYKGNDNKERAGDSPERLENDVLIESDGVTRKYPDGVTGKYPDGGWGWMIVLGCILLRTIIGGFVRSSGLFYVKFLEKYGETASATAWVTSLSATVRLLIGPVVSILCNRFSRRKLTCFGAAIFVIAVHATSYANSLLYLYFSYGVLGGFGRSFVLTPLTILLGEYFDKRRSLAFGLASAGFGIGGFAITPTIELMFQEYGFRGTYILLSGIACNLFVCVSLFRPAPMDTSHLEKTIDDPKTVKETKTSDEKNSVSSGEEEEALQSYVFSTGSIHLFKERDGSKLKPDMSEHLTNGYSKRKAKQESDNTKRTDRKKLISFSVLKDIRFVTLCLAAFIFTLPSSGLFLPALVKSRGLSDIQAAYLLSVIAGSDTVSRVISGFVLDLKGVRNLRPYIYNSMSFIQCIAQFCFQTLRTFEQFTAVCVLHGCVMGAKAAQRNVILVDILGVDKLTSSFAILLAVQGIGTLIGPPVSGFLKDTYGKYDYTFYFGGTCVLCGALILAGGNIRNYFNKKKTK